MDGGPTCCLSNMECTNALMYVRLSVPLTALRSSGARDGSPMSGSGDGVGVSGALTPFATASATGGNVYLEQPVSVRAVVPRCVRDGWLRRVVRAALSALCGGSSIAACGHGSSSCVCCGVTGAA